MWELTNDKYTAMWWHLKKMRVKDKRQLFLLLRSVPDIDENVFFPAYGLTAGEFATFQILNEYAKKQV